mmetsp:Transcript_33694/g.84584  ORF Transcript_33694/g.84584 Transcript_33694/m.84584 type:complete len:143 (+) Transcript_33694:134-562(+)
MAEAPENLDQYLPHWNAEQLLQVCGDMPDMLAELVDLYLATFPEQEQKLRTSLEAGESNDSRLYAHDIKGSSANMGAESVRKTAAAMEALAKEQKLREAMKLLDELHANFEAVSMVLRGYVNTLFDEEEEEEEAREPSPELS